MDSVRKKRDEKENNEEGVDKKERERSREGMKRSDKLYEEARKGEERRK